MSHFGDSNPRPTHYECVALPTELKWQSYFHLLLRRQGEEKGLQK